MIVLAPSAKSLRSRMSPMRLRSLLRHSFALEASFGVSLHQAGKARAEPNCLPSPIAATIACAVRPPAPGTVESRRITGFPLQSLCNRQDLFRERVHRRPQRLGLREQHAQGLEENLGNAFIADNEQRRHFGKAAPALRGGDALLGELTANAVQELRVLLDQEIARPFAPAMALD